MTESMEVHQALTMLGAPAAQRLIVAADLLAPARGPLAVSTWPMERRVIGPLRPRVNYLEAAIRVAEGLLRIPGPGVASVRLLRRFAANIPGASDGAIGDSSGGRGSRAGRTGDPRRRGRRVWLRVLITITAVELIALAIASGAPATLMRMFR